MIKDYTPPEDDEEVDIYSPTGWERQVDESDEDYEERMDDQESYLESFFD